MKATKRLAGITALVVWASACDDDPQSHIYVASLYQPSVDCFGPSTSLAQIATPNGDLDCAPTCLVQSMSGGPSEIYVSTMCGPYPAGYDTSQTDPGCPAALAAWPAQQGALAHGSDSCAIVPSPAEDAGEGGPSLEGGQGGGAVDASIGDGNESLDARGDAVGDAPAE